MPPPALVELDEPAEPARAEVRAALERLVADAPTLADATTVLAARGEELEVLLAAAAARRDEHLAGEGRPGVVTYSPKVFVPLTRLCQDRCHYCTFATVPGRLPAAYLERDEVLEIARAGAEQGCTEVLFTLGDRPEARWAAARDWLGARNLASTLDHVYESAEAVLQETGLLPHLNPGVMDLLELQRLRSVSPSMGMMLETTATRLWSQPGGAHFGSPDKEPALRRRVIDDAGRARVPFTTGILVGIGEHRAERAQSLLLLAESARRGGHVQEVIVQNFRAKPDTAMRGEPDAEFDAFVAAVAVARLIMPLGVSVQAPPNLAGDLDDSASAAQDQALLLRAGIDDWGGVSPVTPDHVNPERPWPGLDALRQVTGRGRVHARPAAHDLPPLRARPEHLAAPRPRRPGDRPGRPARARPRAPAQPPPDDRRPMTAPARSALARAENDPAGLSDEAYVDLLAADGEELEALAELADEVRREVVGDQLTFVANRNLDTAVVRDPEHVAALADEAWALGATEVCVQGPLPPDAPDRGQLDLLALITGRAPLHVHGFRPAEVADGAARLGLSPREFLEAARDAGLGSVPGTAARILDDDIRARLTGGTDIPAARWIELITTAHEVGLRSTATMVYGHVETPADQVAHLRTLAAIQDRTGGFTEMIAMPIPPEALPAGGFPDVQRQYGPHADTTRETRALYAVTRLLLHGRIAHVQAAWPKFGPGLTEAVLRGGADDVGGLLLDGVLDPSAGAEAGRALTLAEVEALAADLGRTPRQRTTVYGDPPADRVAVLRGDTP